MYKKATRKGFLRVPRASTLVKKRWQILNTIKPNLIDSILEEVLFVEVSGF